MRAHPCTESRNAMSHLSFFATRLPGLDHPGNLFRNPLGVGQAGAGPPQHEGLVAILHGPNMVRAIFIYFGVGINEFELDPKQLKVVVLSGQEKTSWPGMKLFGKALEHGWSVVLGVDREGVHKNIPAHSIAEELLHLHQMRRCQGASIRAACVHEVDGYDLVSEQIVVEVHLLPFVRRQRHVGKMQPSNLPAGRDPGSPRRGARLASRQRPDGRSKRSRCEQLSSGYRWHESAPVSSPCAKECGSYPLAAGFPSATSSRALHERNCGSGADSARSSPGNGKRVRYARFGVDA